MASFIAGGAPGIYNTAKFAVRGLSYSLRHSMYKYGVGVSVVHPGLVKSVIYASDDVRPDSLKGEMKPVDQAAVERLAGVHEFGMEPDVIGARILEGVRENRANIFTHPDHKDELRELFDEILADYRDYPKDAGYEQRTRFRKDQVRQFRGNPPKGARDMIGRACRGARQQPFAVDLGKSRQSFTPRQLRCYRPPACERFS